MTVDPWLELDLRSKRRWVSAAIRCVTPRQQTVLLLYLVGHSNREIGAILGVSPQCIALHVMHATETLRGVYALHWNAALRQRRSARYEATHRRERLSVWQIGNAEPDRPSTRYERPTPYVSTYTVIPSLHKPSSAKS